MKKLKRYSDFNLYESEETKLDITTEQIDIVIESFSKNPDISIKALSQIRKYLPDLYNKIKNRMEEKGITSHETSADLGDLGF